MAPVAHFDTLIDSYSSASSFIRRCALWEEEEKASGTILSQRTTATEAAKRLES